MKWPKGVREGCEKKRARGFFCLSINLRSNCAFMSAELVNNKSLFHSVLDFFFHPGRAAGFKNKKLP